MLHQLIERDVGIVDLRANAVDHFDQIVRRNVRRHSNRDSGAAVDEKIWKRRRENGRLGPGLVVVRDEIDRVLVHVDHERGAKMGHARLGVTHGRGWIAFDRSEIALTVHQPLAHRPRLRHMDQGGVDHRFAVRVIVTAGVTANFRAFPMLPAGEERQIVHRVENSALRRFQPVARVRQRARNDDRHRVIEERPRHFFSDVDRLYFFVRVIHKS